jgi:predicted RNase H-like HicB family nuclease
MRISKELDMERTRSLRQVIIESEEEGGYHIYCPSLPGCHSQGETIDEALANIREAIDLFVEDMLDNGETVPDDTLDRALFVV